MLDRKTTLDMPYSSVSGVCVLVLRDFGQPARRLLRLVDVEEPGVQQLLRDI
jgi:hypothetical protein